MPTICVFAASSSACDEKYRIWARQIARSIAQAGWDLVFGGSNMGLMAVVAETFKKQGRRVISVIPSSFAGRCLPFPQSDEIIEVESLRIRKEIMGKHADAYLALTGGCGTLDEFNEILTLKHLNMAPEPLLLFNPENYWQPFLAMLDRFDLERFSRTPSRLLFQEFDNPASVLSTLDDFRLERDKITDEQ